MRLIREIFYWPGDWLADHTNVRQRRALSAWLLIFWIFPGFPLWLSIKNALWFVGLMSLVALWWTGLSTIGTETPVEVEGEQVDVENAQTVEGGDIKINN